MADAFALYFTLPGYGGCISRRRGNLMLEELGFTEKDHEPDMIIAAPQLNDWGVTYGAEPSIEAYDRLHELYEKAGALFV